MDPVESMIGTFRDGGSALVVTGAGMGLASGIATFRGKDPGAVWSSDVMAKGTRSFFEKDPAGSWSWYLGRFDGVRDAEPNAGHHALKQVESTFAASGRTFTLVTQNIDGLHAAAGSSAIEVHGAARKVRCYRNGCPHGTPRGTLPLVWDDFAAFRADPRRENLPRCPGCRALLRPHVLWFDEYYDEHEDYRYADVLPAASGADLILFVGTSFSVGVTFNVVEIGLARGTPMFSIDPSAPAPHRRITGVREAQEDVLPRLAAALSAS